MKAVLNLLVLLLLSFGYAQDIQCRPHLVVGANKMDPPSSKKLNNVNIRKRSGPQPLNPEQIKKAYGISLLDIAGAGKTIAIVDAFGASNLESDLQVFSQEFNLPGCTITNGCLIKVNQSGGSDLPPDSLSSSWGMEASIDVQAVHAIAPGARILYVAATSGSISDLFSAVEYAAHHADYVSMSWGAPEGAYAIPFDTTVFAPFSSSSSSSSSSPSSSVSFFASTGDYGSSGGISYPSSSSFVVAVGGTTIELDEEGEVIETGWSGSGGGCSDFVSASNIQNLTLGYNCKGKKSLPDVAALADPSTGLIGYYSPGCANPPSCYYSFGGTSLATPIWAAMAAVKQVDSNILNYIYSNNIKYRDITSGSNGAYSCTEGLDLVTGLGSWEQNM